MKKKVFSAIIILLFGLTAHSQQVSRIDFDSIKIKLTSASSLYKGLLDRFEVGDTTLTAGDYNVIYYGQCFQKEYNPYSGDSKSIDKFKELYDKDDFAKALPYALKILDKDPLDMRMTFKALVCYYKLKDIPGQTLMNARYNHVMLSVYQSGDGKTAPTAFVVMRVSDEYELMGKLELENTSQSLVGDCDVMELKENDLGIKKFYFNISKPFGALSKMLQKK